MDWPAELTACLPPLRSDEPPELRRRIALELADHWQCALQRELTKNGGDLERATQQAARRVGDLRAIARRLWFEAMWEKIMLQRILVGTSVLAAALACAAVGILWSAVRQTNAATAELRYELQRGLADLTTVMREQQSASSSSRVPNANDAVLTSLKLVDDTGATVPRLDELRVEVSRFNEGSVVDSNPRTPRSGIIPLGHLTPGEYSAKIKDPAGETCRLNFVVQPSLTPLEVVIPCPSPQRVTTEVQIDWPPSFIEHHLGLLVVCERRPRTIELTPEAPGSQRLVIATSWEPSAEMRLLLFRPGTSCVEYTPPSYQIRTGSTKPESRSWLQLPPGPRELSAGELTFLDGDWAAGVSAVVWQRTPNSDGLVAGTFFPKTLRVAVVSSLSPGDTPSVLSLTIPRLLQELVEKRIAAGSLDSDL